MLVLRSDRFSFVRWHQALFHLGMGSFGTALLFLGYVFLFEFSFQDALGSRETMMHAPVWDFRMIDRGLLALRDKNKQIPPFLRSIAVRAKNTRPDAQKSSFFPQMLLEIKGSSRTRPASSGEKLFLHWEPLHEGEAVKHGPPAPLSWSEEEGPLTLTPFVSSIQADEGSFFFTADLTEHGKSGAETIPFLIDVSPNEENSQERSEVWLENIASARFWTKDLFFELYGGKRGQETDGYKLAIESKQGVQIHCMREGDFLVYENGVWVKSPIQNAAGKPLAQVIHQKVGSLYMRVWDESGFMSQILALPPAALPLFSYKVEDDFLSLRLRNSTEITCLLGKRRVVLKPGDWWLKEEGRNWRNIKQLAEIDDLLSFKYKGELFVIDSLEKNNGRSFLKGRIFDKTRQMVQPVSLAVAEGRTAPPPAKRPPTHTPPNGENGKKEAQPTTSHTPPVSLTRQKDEAKP